MVCLFAALILFSTLSGAAAHDTTIYIGAYTQNLSWVGGSPGEGISVYHHDVYGNLKFFKTYTNAGENPSYLHISSKKDTLYASNEVQDGSVVAFSIDKYGGLTKVNSASTGGQSPVQLLTDANDEFLFTAHYGGSISVNKLYDNGSIGPIVASHTFEGHSGVDPNRQEAPHAHGVTLKDNYFVFVPDLGSDKVHQFVWDPKAMSLKVNPISAAYKAAPGSGPRHMLFHPSLPRAYLVNELTNQLDVLAYDGYYGTLTHLMNTSTTGAETGTQQLAAALHFDSSGKYLYVSNRGEDDSISVFEVHAKTGFVKFNGKFDSGGEAPRDFGLLNDHTIMSANQDSNSLIVFRKDANGKFVRSNISPAITGNPTRVAVMIARH